MAFLVLNHFYCECIRREIAKKSLKIFNAKYNSLIKLKVSLIIRAVVYLPNLWVNYLQLVSLM